MLVLAIIDLRSSRNHPLGDIETFIRREDAELAMTAASDLILAVS